jgi:hypothetical protein
MLFDGMGASRPFEAMAGDVVRIADWGPGQVLELRIVQTDADADNRTVQLGVERPVSLDGLLGHRRHRHGKGGKG